MYAAIQCSHNTASEAIQRMLIRPNLSFTVAWMFITGSEKKAIIPFRDGPESSTAIFSRPCQPVCTKFQICILPYGSRRNAESTTIQFLRSKK